jgi:uncharacterized RDD family membrane protein YckC
MPPDYDSRGAGLGIRCKAFFFDGMVLGALLLMSAALGMVLRLIAGSVEYSPAAADALAFVALILPVILYCTWAESSPRQATFGKRRAGLVVVSISGGRLSRKRALLRSALKFLPWQLAHSCLFRIPGWPSDPQEPSPLIWSGLILAQALVLLTLLTLTFGQRRTPYDRLSGSLVVAARGRE